MPITIEATYEGGVLKPDRPLPLKEKEKVQITVEPQDNWVKMTAGMLGWQGTAEELERVALDPEFGIHESP